MFLTVHITLPEWPLWLRVALSVLALFLTWRWVRWHFARINAEYEAAKKKIAEDHKAAMREIDERYRALEALAPFYRPVSPQEAEAAALLGVGVNATIDEIRAAYRRKARLVHPDRVPEEERDVATARLVACNGAFVVMTNRWRRWRPEGMEQQR